MARKQATKEEKTFSPAREAVFNDDGTFSFVDGVRTYKILPTVMGWKIVDA